MSRQLKKEEELLSEQCGTPAYMAPEVHAAKGKIKGKPTDVWSLGVCLYAMFVGMVPFRGKTIEELQELIIKGDFSFPSSADGLSKQAKKLIQGMLERDPDKRLDANQVAKHHGIQEHSHHLPHPSSTPLGGDSAQNWELFAQAACISLFLFEMIVI